MTRETAMNGNEREKMMSGVFQTLYARREAMEQFMDGDIFKDAGCSKDEFIDDKEQFISFIEVCSQLRSYPARPEIIKRIGQDFSQQYPRIKNLIRDKNIGKLQEVFYDVKGIGQMIGSLMLELIFLYSNYRDEEAAKELYVPICTHTKRIFEESFGLQPPEIGVSPFASGFTKFQKNLNDYTGGKPRVYFDYLWYIGKEYCGKTSEDGTFSRGCKDCWIEKHCCCPMKMNGQASAETMRGVFQTLYAKREEMEQFMDREDIFKRAGCSKDEFIDDKEQFISFIKVCSKLGGGPARPEIINGIPQEFSQKYPRIKNLIRDKNIRELQKVFYGVKGIGQMIGSLMLELIFLYSNYRDEEAAKELYVPICTPTKRIFEESFGLQPPGTEVSPFAPGFIEFQETLNDYTGGKPRVYFDYLWRIGKKYCKKGYKLCKDCWIEKHCCCPMKWKRPGRAGVSEG